MNMKHSYKAALAAVLALFLLASLSPRLIAAEPSSADLDAAISSGDFNGYVTNLTTWLSQKAPADSSKITQAALAPVLQNPAVSLALAQRQFIVKVGNSKLGAFAKADPANKVFLTWLLKNPLALHEYLIAVTPLSQHARDDNSFGISTASLETWKKIFTADPQSKQGVYLRLAIATALRPPGTGSPGSGQQKIPSPPLVRYNYFKTAHEKKELFPSFDKLTAWEMQFVVCSGASEADLTWGREMVNTWRPDLRTGERVVDTTSMVWRRNSPVPHVDYKAVLDGGGKCGPRSSWSVFICQAWGIPAIGVGQPRHACVAYKSLNGWQVAYGRGWDASKLEGMGGREFLASVTDRERTEVFSQVEQLRWFASTLTAKEQIAAVRAIGQTLAKSAPTLSEKKLKASEKADEADDEPRVAGPAKNGPAVTKGLAKAESSAAAPPGVIRIDGTGFFETGGITVWGGEPRVTVMDSIDGGKQVHFQQGMASTWVGYKIDVPETGIYELTAKVATVNNGQAMFVRSFGAMAPVKKATASAVWKGTKELGPQAAVDNNPSTRWAVNFGVDKAWIELDLGQPTKISTIMIDERAYEKVAKFLLEYKDGNEWKKILEGTTIGSSYAKDFPEVTAQHVRLSTLDCSGKTGGPTFWEISVGSVQDGHGWIALPWTAGLWQTTKPMDIRLAKGQQTIWLFTPYQRGVAMKSFDLKLKGREVSSTSPQSNSRPE
ncbi:MAG: discoidin domain-containing protein [Planctomycetia bacterium]|nr:discoidin domain-containing protein [Planctomycetia bacterium]